MALSSSSTNAAARRGLIADFVTLRQIFSNIPLRQGIRDGGLLTFLCPGRSPCDGVVLDAGIVAVNRAAVDAARVIATEGRTAARGLDVWVLWRGAGRGAARWRRRERGAERGALDAEDASTEDVPCQNVTFRTWMPT